MSEETVSLPPEIGWQSIEGKAAVTERQARPGQGGGRRPQNGYAAMTNAERQARFRQARRDEAARKLQKEQEAREEAARHRQRVRLLDAAMRDAAKDLLGEHWPDLWWKACGKCLPVSAAEEDALKEARENLLWLLTRRLP